MNACRSSNLIPVHASILRWVLLLALVFASAASAKARESDSQAKAFVAGAAAVVTGGHHTCAIGTGGVVMCWGSNQYGQLGNGSIIDSAAPVAVTGVSDANALAAGFTFTCAIISGGAVKCWGSNTFGELGNGSTTGSSLAVDVGDVDGATALAAGNSHACAIVQNGALKCWGKNFDGALGNGNTSSSSVAVDVADVSGAIALVAGSDHTCAVVAGGAVHCWGSNRYGQLGNGSTNSSTTAVPATGISGATAVAAGSYHTCAAFSGGAVKCWGLNADGQLGDGSTNNHALAMPAVGVGGATALSAGYSHTCALVADGAIRCWGANSLGQLGDGTSVPSATAVSVRGVRGAISLAAGASHTCAMVVGGALPCWGANSSGQLGTGLTEISNTPVNVSGVIGASAVAAGVAHTCAIATNGAIKCWGANDFGQLGIGSVSNSPTAVDVAGIHNTIALAAGWVHTCAVIEGGAVWCWGRNVLGELGNGSTSNSWMPVQAIGVTGATGISAGVYHTCALTADGAVECWGSNQFGQLGTGSTTNSSTAVPATGISGASAVAAGAYHTCAAFAGGAVKCWGGNSDGQLGTGGFADSMTAVAVTDVNGVTALAAGWKHSCAVLAAGNVKCWGSNTQGQLGDGSIYSGSPTAVDVLGVSGAILVAAGVNHTCAVVSNGAVKCWGDNHLGQLGDGSKNRSLTAVSVLGISGAVALAAGGNHTCAVVAGGEIKCWGWRRAAQLGDVNPGYATGTPLLQSTSTTATLANAYSGQSVASRNASKIVFVSDANNLAADPNNRRDVFLRDPAARTTVRISATAEAINGGASEDFYDPAISDDGARIAFSGSSGQVYAAVNGQGRVLSSSVNGVVGNGPSGSVQLPGRGHLAFFESQATNLGPVADGNGSVPDIFVKDLESDVVRLITSGANGEPANGASRGPWASADGDTIVFSTLASNIVPDAQQMPHSVRTAMFQQVAMIRGEGSAPSRLFISKNLASGELGNGDSINVQLTPDGRFGVFESLADNLVEGDTNHASDIFRFELDGDTVVSLIPVSTSALGFGNGGSRRPSVSDDGQSIAFETDATNLVDGDANNVSDVVVKSLLTGDIVRLAPTIDGMEPNGASREPAISPDGATVTYTSSASNLAPNDTNGVADVFSVEIRAPVVPGASSPLDEPGFTGFSLPPAGPSFPNCPGGYFVAVVDDGPGAGLTPGIFGLELLLDLPGTQRLEGGLNFGGLVDGSQVAFAGFNFQNAASEPQRLDLTMIGAPSSNREASLPVRIKLIRQPAPNVNEVVLDITASLTIATQFTRSIELTPAYYVVTVAPEGAASVPGGAADGEVYVSATTQFVDRPGGGFFAGAVVGGYHAAHPFGGVSGYGAFCLGTQHSATARVLSAPTYGSTGARDLRLRLLDYTDQAVITVPQ